MTLQEVIRKTRRRPSDEEHRLQCACVKWFRMQYPQLSHALFAVPNGSRRDAVTGARLKAEGVLAGVSDLILLKSNKYYGALLVEMKTPRGVQSASQKEWQRRVEADGEYLYCVVRTFGQFVDLVRSYLKMA